MFLYVLLLRVFYILCMGWIFGFGCIGLRAFYFLSPGRCLYVVRYMYITYMFVTGFATGCIHVYMRVIYRPATLWVTHLK